MRFPLQYITQHFTNYNRYTSRHSRHIKHYNNKLKLNTIKQKEAWDPKPKSKTDTPRPFYFPFPLKFCAMPFLRATPFVVEHRVFLVSQILIEDYFLISKYYINLRSIKYKYYVKTS